MPGRSDRRPGVPQTCLRRAWIVYAAHSAELLPLPTSVTLAYTWVTAGSHPDDQFELRDPQDRVRGWQPANGRR